MFLGSPLLKEGIRSREPLWLRMIQTVVWIVSCEGEPDVVNTPGEVRPWAYPGWHVQVRHCKAQPAVNRLPGSTA